MTSRIVCKSCESESFADGASLACWKCYTASQAEVERLRAALEAAESQIHYLKKELVARQSELARED